MLTLRLLLSMALRLVAKSIQLHAQSGQPWLIELRVPLKPKRLTWGRGGRLSTWAGPCAEHAATHSDS